MKIVLHFRHEELVMLDNLDIVVDCSHRAISRLEPYVAEIAAYSL